MTDTEDDVEVREEFTFDQLSESAKDKARDKYRYNDGYPHHEWWDYIYEDAVRMGKLIGIDIDVRRSMTRLGKPVEETAINFSGFCSQGDGACFEGEYSFLPDAIKNVEQETTDEELLTIARELTLMQMTRRLLGQDYFSATITTSGRYSHSGTMSVDLHVNDEDEDYDSTGLVQDEVQQLMRNFADWIYKNLEAENDYLCSDECIDQYLIEEKFDESGVMI